MDEAILEMQNKTKFVIAITLEEARDNLINGAISAADSQHRITNSDQDTISQSFQNQSVQEPIRMTINS